MPVQRSNGSNVAAWMTRVPPATGSSRQLHSLSNPDAGDPHAEARLRPRLEALDPGRVAQQPEPGVRRPGRRGRRPGRRRRPEPELREERGRRGRVVERRPDRPRRGMDEDAPLDGAPWRARSPSSATARPAPPPGADGHRQPPIGCQTVFISRKAAIHSGRSAAASSSQSKRASATVVGRRRRRLMSSAASVSTSVRSSSGTPHVSSASTSAWAGQDRHELRLAARSGR